VIGGAVARHPPRHFDADAPRPAVDLVRVWARKSPLGSCSRAVLIGMLFRSCAILARPVSWPIPKPGPCGQEVSGQNARQPRPSGLTRFGALSLNDGNAMTYLAVEKIVSVVTKEAIGVDISPHLFRAVVQGRGAGHVAVLPDSLPRHFLLRTAVISIIVPTPRRTMQSLGG
jgi:hypothetical protein